MRTLLGFGSLSGTKFEDQETSFARVGAYRQGFLDGADSCASFVQVKQQKKSKANDEG